MGNDEWNHGMGMKLGLYAVDPSTKARDVPADLESKYASYYP